MGKNKFLAHAPCPSCGSSDALAVYEDGCYCMAAGCQFMSQDIEEHLANSGRKQYNRKPKMTFTPIDVRPIEKMWRSINPETFARFGVGLTGNNDVVFPYYVDGVQVGAKLRASNAKEFSFRGDSSEVQLFGQQAANGDRRVIVTEGELDALAATQMTGYPAVSVPFGADSADKHIKRALQWLEKFDEVVLCFDADKPGQEAQAKAMKLLKPGKGKSMVLPTGFKDANDMLKAGKAQEFKTAYYAAQSMLPSGIVSKSDIIDRTLTFIGDRDKRMGLPTGYAGLDELIGGWRPGEVHTWAAGTGIGKSTVTRTLCYLQAKRGVKSLYIPLEDLTEVSAARFVEMDMGAALIKGTQLPMEDIRTSLEELLDNIIIFDQKGGMSVDSLVNSIEYAVRTQDVKFIVLDHITAMANSVASDERKALDICIEALKIKVAVALRCTVLVVSHLSRDSGDSEDNKPTLSRIKGASSISQYSDGVFAITRDREGDNVMTVKTLKANRLWGVYGSFELVWDSSLQQLVEVRNEFDQGKETDVIQQEPPTAPTQTDKGSTEVQKSVREKRVAAKQPIGDEHAVRTTEDGVEGNAHLHTRPGTTVPIDSGAEGVTHSPGQTEDVACAGTTPKRSTRPALPA